MDKAKHTLYLGADVGKETNTGELCKNRGTGHNAGNCTIGYKAGNSPNITSRAETKVGSRLGNHPIPGYIAPGQEHIDDKPGNRAIGYKVLMENTTGCASGPFGEDSVTIGKFKITYKTPSQSPVGDSVIPKRKSVVYGDTSVAIGNFVIEYIGA